MKFTYAQEFTFEADANDARGICEALWHGQRFYIHSTLESWMKANAQVARIVTGNPCSSANFEEHVQDLFNLGLLKQANED